MKVRALLDQLEKIDPDFEVLYCDEEGDDHFIDYVYVEERQYGILLKPMPPKTKVVILS